MLMAEPLHWKVWSEHAPCGSMYVLMYNSMRHEACLLHASKLFLVLFKPLQQILLRSGHGTDIAANIFDAVIKRLHDIFGIVCKCAWVLA